MSAHKPRSGPRRESTRPAPATFGAQVAAHVVAGPDGAASRLARRLTLAAERGDQMAVARLATATADRDPALLAAATALMATACADLAGQLAERDRRAAGLN